MKKIQSILLVLCLSASCANAVVITQTRSIPVNTPGSTYNLEFEQFNTKGYRTLQSIQIVYNLYIYGGSVAVDNDSASSQTVTAIISLDGRLTSTTVGLYNTTADIETGGFVTPWRKVANEISKEFTLSPTTGDNIGEYNNTGLGDSAVFTGPTSGNAHLETRDDFVNSAAYAGYMGTGTYIISALTTQTSKVEGNAQYSVTMMQTYGDVTVTYTYVPEPATASLTGIGLLMLLRRRRQA